MKQDELTNNPDDILGMSDLPGQVEQSSDSDLRDDGIRKISKRKLLLKNY